MKKLLMTKKEFMQAMEYLAYDYVHNGMNILLENTPYEYSDGKIYDIKHQEIWWSSDDYTYIENINDCDMKIHPTQKPIALYRWLLQNYAKPGDKIIDTHSGSGSLACACHLEKFDFLAIEKDEDYYKASVERLDTLRSQGVLF